MILRSIPDEFVERVIIIHITTPHRFASKNFSPKDRAIGAAFGRL
jgi:hypothetical protein